MANDLKITIPVKDGKGLNEQKMDALFQQLEEFVNNIKLNADNIQASSITFDEFQQPIVDDTYLEFDTTVSVGSSSLTSVVIGEIGSVSKISDRRVNKGHFVEKSATVSSNAAVQDAYINSQTTGTIAALSGTDFVSFAPAASFSVAARQRPLLVTLVPTGDSATPGYIEFNHSRSSGTESWQFTYAFVWVIGGVETYFSSFIANVQNLADSGTDAIGTSSTTARMRLPSVPPILIPRNSSDADEDLTIELQAKVVNNIGTSAITSDTTVSLVNMKLVATEI